ncbi:MAG: FAD-dependent oxidoreductase [Candidatus Limnocylindria bacterium]
MLTPTPLHDQLDAVRGDPLRVLIAGAGIAGTTLAQLLRVDGLHPVVVERSRPDADPGYMIALIPLVDPVLDRLGVWDAYRDQSVEFRRYRLRDSGGRVIREYPMGELLNRYGEYRGLDRGSLLDVLASKGGTVSHETTVAALDQDGNAVRAALHDGRGETTAEFDLVVAADGLHSGTRELVLRPDQVSTFDSKWGGWIAWADADDEQDLGEETWGAGFFIGSYPVKDRVGVIVGGDRRDTAEGKDAFVAGIRRQISDASPRLDRSLAAVAEAADPYFWSLTDCRADEWVVGRVLLLGDAAAGFLPTAGIGAGMAMESAWVLAERLRGLPAAEVPTALTAYQRAQRPRVEAAQDNSRQLARLMFRRNAILARLRDIAARFITLDMALGPIRRLLEEQPQPGAGSQRQ